MIEHWMLKKMTALFVSGDLPEHKRVQFEKHMDRCLRCRDEVGALARLSERLKGDPVPSPSPTTWNEFSKNLSRAIKAGNVQRIPFPDVSRPALRSAWMLPVGAAALLLVLFSGVILMKGPILPESDLALTRIEEERLVVELSGFDNDILQEVLGLPSPGSGDWQNVLMGWGVEDIEAVNLSANALEEDFWDEPELLEEVLEEMMEEVLS